MDGVDRDEGVLVFLEHDFLELVDLEARDDAVEHFLGLARVAALPVQQRDAAAESVIEGRGDLIVLVRDDHDGVRLVEAFDDDIDHLRDDEVRDERVHRLVPAVEQARTRQDEEVDEHDDLAD